MNSDSTTNIIKYIIRNVPYGLLKETLEHLKLLVGQSALEQKEIQEELAVYDEEHLKQINYNDEKIILSKLNKDNENFYIDQHKKSKFSIEPLSENFDKIVNLDGHELEQNNFFNFISKYLLIYKEKNFENNISAATGRHF
jgi:hypothetical protein